LYSGHIYYPRVFKQGVAEVLVSIFKICSTLYNESILNVLKLIKNTFCHLSNHNFINGFAMKTKEKIKTIIWPSKKNIYPFSKTKLFVPNNCYLLHTRAEISSQILPILNLLVIYNY